MAPEKKKHLRLSPLRCAPPLRLRLSVGSSRGPGEVAGGDDRTNAAAALAAHRGAGGVGWGGVGGVLFFFPKPLSQTVFFSQNCFPKSFFLFKGLKVSKVFLFFLKKTL